MTSERVLALAERFVAGEPIDWEAELHSSAGPEERGVVNSMRVLELIARAHHSPNRQPLQNEPAGSDLDPPADPAESAATQTLHVTPGRGRQDGQGLTALRWGRLENLEEIGRGCFGVVYKAWDPRLSRHVALKLSRTTTNGGRNRAMLEEAKLLAQLQNENVVHIIDATEQGGEIGIWMDLIDGRCLDKIVEFEGEMDEDRATAIGAKLARALAAVHGAGVIHKDIKAHNVMISAGGRIVLMDFGSGAKIEASENEPMPRALRGTPCYLAPEVLDGGAPTLSSDIYSLGVLLFFLVTKRYPIEANTLSELQSKHRAGEYRALVDLRPQLSARFCRVVERALDPDPERRFESAGRMALALEPPPPIPPPDRLREWIRRVALAAAPLALAALSWLVYMRATTYAVDSSLFRATGQGGEALSSGSVIRPGDGIYMEIEASRPVYVYVLDQDDRGEAAVLFPIPGLEPGNPLQADRRYHLPGFLDTTRVNWQVTSAGGRDHYIIVASPKPLLDLERELAKIPPARFGHSIQFPKVRLPQIVGLRGIMGLAPADTGRTTSVDNLLMHIREITAGPDKQRGVWVRRIDLVNPETP